MTTADALQRLRHLCASRAPRMGRFGEVQVVRVTRRNGQTGVDRLVLRHADENAQRLSTRR
jgi:hypothetical protein